MGCGDKQADAVKTYSEIVLASYEDSLSTAQALQTAVDALVATPSEATLQAAKDAWLASRVPYLQTEVYRFYDGPIDNATDGPEGMLNAWPLDEHYIDYTTEDATAGIVNSDQTIDAAGLRDLNEKDGDANIATGYHAVEFLLWGQDLSETGPGARPHTDYLDSAANHDRRGLYLKTAAAMIVEDLQTLVNAWKVDATYRKDIEDAESKEGVRRIMTGMIVLSGFETGGERLKTAYDNMDQEDEHSCFSDNTHVDMIEDVRGVQNVWLGSYTRVDGSKVEGSSLKDAIADVDSALADRLTSEIADSLAKANDLPTPFDQAIASGNEAGRAKVMALITALRTQEATLEEIFQLLELTIPQPE
jgi:putative iron-regulated protein